MIRSFQNIVASVAAISAIALITTLLISASHCSNASGCTAAATLYKLSYEKDFKSPQSTETISKTTDELVFNEVAKTTRVVSTYALVAAISIMIALEAFELRYLKLFLTAKKRRPTVSRR